MKRNDNNKKREKLGMNPSTAHRRLLKDLLFKYVMLAGNKCLRCNQELTKETFSVDHIKPWLNSETPVELYFDLDNIAFSHLNCNTQEMADRRRLHSPEAKIILKRNKNRERAAKNYTPEARQERYIKYGC